MTTAALLMQVVAQGGVWLRVPSIRVGIRDCVDVVIVAALPSICGWSFDVWRSEERDERMCQPIEYGST